MSRLGERGRALLAEFLGSAGLALVVIGSGIAAQRLSPGAVGLELAENAAATGLGLYVLIALLGPVSGAHFNPVVSVDAALDGRLARRWLAPYVAVQVLGCAAGAVLANAMFSDGLVHWSHTARASGPHALSEAVATAGLVLVIGGLARSGATRAIPAAVGGYIAAAYFFCSSTSFANPAITLGRSLSDTFAGIAPSSVPTFLAAQVVGGVAGGLGVRLLFPARARAAVDA